MKANKTNYSVCHNGPLKYFTSWRRAYGWRNRQYLKGYFLDPDTRAKIPCKPGELTIFNLND